MSFAGLALTGMIGFVDPVMADVRITSGRLGNVFAPSETSDVIVTTTAKGISWTLTDMTGRLVDQGQAPSDKGAVKLPLRWDKPGYFELEARTVDDGGQPDRARASFAVIAQPAPSQSVRFGVMTHFAQGWDTDIIPLIVRAGIKNVRDELYWANTETTPGHYALPERYVRYMDALEAQGITPLIVLSFANKLYDDGNTPHTDAGRQAFARYGDFIASAFTGRVPALEVWNEFNGSFCKGPCGDDRPEAYASLLATTYRMLKTGRPGLIVAGGAAVLAPRPWFDALFDKGALDTMDAVIIHPYTSDPEGVEADIRTLRDSIRRHTGGKSKPIWATEFGRFDHSPNGRAAIADYLVRISTIMVSEGVERLYWYLLRDYDKFETMGLVRKPDAPYGRYAPTPAYVAYANLIARLADAKPLGREVTDPRSRIYRFDVGGRELRVAWSVEGDSRLRMAAERPIRVTDIVGSERTVTPQNGWIELQLSRTPVYIEGPVGGFMEPDRRPMVADSRADFDADPQGGAWSYSALVQQPLSPGERRNCDAPEAAGRMETLEWRANNWGYAWRGRFRDFQIDGNGAHPAVSGKTPIWAVRRWHANVEGRITVEGNVARPSKRGDGICAMVLFNGRTIWSSAVGGPNASSNISFTLNQTVSPGTILDFVVTPGSALDVDFDTTSFRLRIERDDS